MDEKKTVRITVALPRDVVERLDTYAQRRRWSRSTAAATLIERGLPAAQPEREKAG
jgi:metal-responsive CopG/Arc/MetJ family transcriptional regulator